MREPALYHNGASCKEGEVPGVRALATNGLFPIEYIDCFFLRLTRLNL